MKKYFEELQGEFGDEKPCDKYALYKRLSKVRRNVDRKYSSSHPESRASTPSLETLPSKSIETNFRKNWLPRRR